MELLAPTVIFFAFIGMKLPPNLASRKGRSHRATRWGCRVDIGISGIGRERVFERIDVHGSHILVVYRDDTGGRGPGRHGSVFCRGCPQGRARGASLTSVTWR